MLSTATSQSLLAGLADPNNQTAWRQYVDRYRPLLSSYAERLGVPRSDLEDLAQQTLLAFSLAYREGQYDVKRGRLRSWLFGIATGTIRNYWRSRHRIARVGGTGDGDAVALIADDRRLDQIWEEQWRDAVVTACLREVRAEVEAHTFAAFDLFACQGLPAREVAERLGTTENAVFCAKRRVLARLRELGPAVEDAF